MDTTIEPAAGTSPAPDVIPETPAAAPAPVTPVAEVPVAPAAATPNARDVLSVLSQAERRLLSTGQKSFKEIISARPNKPGAPAPAKTPETPAAAIKQDPAPNPAPASPEPGAPPAPDDMPDRFRFKAPEDQAIAMIAKSKGVSLREATKLYESDHAPATQPSAPPATPPPPAEDPELKRYETDIGKLTTQITKLAEDRKKAIEDVENEKVCDISDQIADLKADLKLLQHERTGFVRNREQASAQNAERQILDSHARALSKYPELAVEGSMPRLALEQYVNRALADPKRAPEFNDPRWPERLTEEFAKVHKIGSAAPTPAATPAARLAQSPTPPPSSLRPRPQQVPGAKLVDGADGSQPSAAAGKPTLADLQAALPRMSPAQRRELLLRASGKGA